MIKKILFAITFLILLLYGWNTFRNNYFWLLNKEPHLDAARYPAELDSIRIVKKRLRKEKADLTTLENNFVRVMTRRIFPYWYGTKWNFYGTAERPGAGSIACGYFVTTTLRDAGVPIQRSRLAQCPSEEMIRKLTDKKYIHHLSDLSITEFEKKLEKLGRGLYIIGLDTHTGFIQISKHGNFFIHSSGRYPFQVVKEKISEAGILADSKYRVVGKISSDEVFLRKWVKNVE
jgi:hypothetical protein